MAGGKGQVEKRKRAVRFQPNLNVVVTMKSSLAEFEIR